MLDELSKLGASPFQMPISRISMGSSSIIAFTAKDPAPYEKRATPQTIEKARPIPDDIARRMKVEMVDSVTPVRAERVREAYPTPLDETGYEYISSSTEEIPIRVSLVVRYAFKQTSGTCQIRDRGATRGL